jgi:hypothetical protein
MYDHGTGCFAKFGATVVIAIFPHRLVVGTQRAAFGDKRVSISALHTAMLYDTHTFVAEVGPLRHHNSKQVR